MTTLSVRQRFKIYFFPGFQNKSLAIRTTVGGGKRVGKSMEGREREQEKSSETRKRRKKNMLS